MPNWKKVVTSGSNPELNNITASGVIHIEGTAATLPPDGAIKLAYNSDKLSVISEHGYVRLGVVSGDSVKFFTNGDDYHFDESVVVDGGVFASKDEDLILRRDFDDTTYNQIKIADDSYELKLDNTVRHSIDGVGNNTFTGHITASQNISASGTITMLTASIGGGIFTSASLAAGGGGGAVSAVANGSNNRVATFSSGDALNGEANLTFDGTDLTVNGSTPSIIINQNAFGATTDSLITFQKGGANQYTMGSDNESVSKFKINSGGSLANPSDFEMDASGNVTIKGGLTSDGILSSSGDLHIQGNITASAGNFSSHITASGNISSSGNIIGTWTGIPIAHDYIGLDAIDGTNIGDDTINSEHYVAASIDNEHLADDAVGTDEIADNAVTLAKMAGLARGKIISGDSSGNPTALAVGGANTVLQSDGTDITYNTVATAMIADNAVSLAKMAGLARGKIIVGDASGDPSALGAGANGKILVADANGDPSWTSLSGDATLSAGALTIAADSVEGTMLNTNTADTSTMVLSSDTLSVLKVPNALTAGVGLNNGGGTFDGAATRTFSVDSASFAPFYSASMNSFTTAGNISASNTTGTHTFGGQTTVSQITASAFQFVGSGDAELEVDGHITASGNISSSGTIQSTGNITTDGILTGNTGVRVGSANRMIPAGDDITFQDGGIDVNGHITASGNISGSSTTNITIGGDLTVGDDVILTSDSAGVGRGTGQYGQMFFSNNLVQLGATGLGAGIFQVDGHSSPGALFVSSSGKVGIGGGFHSTNEPDEKLTVNGNISASGYLFLQETGSTTGGTDGSSTPYLFASSSGELCYQSGSTATSVIALGASGGGGSGDITSVTAGTGMTGTNESSGDTTLNVIGGNGITANSNDIAITPAQDTITSVLNTALVVGRDGDNQIKFNTDNQIDFDVAGETMFTLKSTVDSGSIAVSGSIKVQPNVTLPAVSESRLYNQATANGNVVDDLHFGTAGLTPAYAWVSLDDDGTSGTGELIYGVGSAVTSTTYNMRVTDASEVKIFSQMDGVYKVTGNFVIEAASATFVSDLNVDGSTVHTYTAKAHSAVDPVERTQIYVGTINSGSYVTATIDATSAASCNYELGSVLLVERLS